MEIRLYKETRKEFRNYADPYTLYFPYPKRLQKREGAKAYYVGGNILSDGTWQGMYSDYAPIGVRVNGNNLHLGKKIKLSEIPEPARKQIQHLSDLWNEAVTKDTDEAWEKWNNN